MEKREKYTASHCAETGYATPLSGKVIVVKEAALPSDHPDQLFCCVGEDAPNPRITDKTVSAVSLSTGEPRRWRRSDVLGTLKPELLPDAARLMLSQVKPYQAAKTPESKEAFTGWCFLPDGRYSTGVRLNSPEEAAAFAKLQMPWQKRVLICDAEDLVVLETMDGAIVFPAPEAQEALRQGNQSHMSMKMGGV